MKKPKLLYAILAIVFTYNVNAQIVYTDINPDSTFKSGGSIDFNNDGTTELSTRNGSYFDGPFYFLPNGNATSGWDIPKSLSANTVIGTTSNWDQYASDCSMDSWGAGTPFPLNQDAFMGIKFTVSGNTHYGWVRIMWDGTNFIYKDFAYESTAKRAIKAGDTGSTTGVNNIEENKNINIYPNPAKDRIIINNNTLSINSKIIIINSLGEIVKEMADLKNTKSLDVSTLKAGIYTITIFENDEIIGYNKLMIE